MSNLTNLTEEQKAHRRLEALAKSSGGKVEFKNSNLSSEEEKKLNLSCEYFNVVLRRTMKSCEMGIRTDTQDPRSIYVRIKIFVIWYSYTGVGLIKPPILTYKWWASTINEVQSYY